MKITTLVIYIVDSKKKDYSSLSKKLNMLNVVDNSKIKKRAKEIERIEKEISNFVKTSLYPIHLLFKCLEK